MCDYCGEKIGCKWTGGKLNHEPNLTADDWKLIFDFIKLIQLPFLHKVIMRANARKDATAARI